MTPKELKFFRIRHRISFIELAATIGLPSDYLKQIEEEEVVALETDLVRIEKGLRSLADNSSREDDE